MHKRWHPTRGGTKIREVRKERQSKRRHSYQQVPLRIPTETDAELLAPRKVDRVLLANRPIQLALERVENEIDLVEQQDTLLEQLEDLGAVINVLGVDGELRHDGLLTETLGDSG